MSINGIGPSIAGIHPPTPGNDKERPGGNAASGESSRSTSPDRVEISDAGRSLQGDLTPELAEIRDRVLSGEYNTPSAAEETARRILASGDLD